MTGVELVTATDVQLMQVLAQRVTATRLDLVNGEAMPYQVKRSDGSVKDSAGTYLSYQVDPEQAGLVDEVIERYDGLTAGTERTVVANAADEFALKRWAARGTGPTWTRSATTGPGLS